jgi:hypothetical protein
VLVWKYSNRPSDDCAMAACKKYGKLIIRDGFTMKGVEVGTSFNSEQNYVFNGKL